MTELLHTCNPVNVIFFRFSHEHPGIVFLKKTPEDDEIPVELLKDPSYRFEVDMRPRILPPPGFSREHTNMSEIRQAACTGCHVPSAC